jgi:hypothetical protein
VKCHLLNNCFEGNIPEKSVHDQGFSSFMTALYSEFLVSGAEYDAELVHSILRSNKYFEYVVRSTPAGTRYSEYSVYSVLVLRVIRTPSRSTTEYRVRRVLRGTECSITGVQYLVLRVE